MSRVKREASSTAKGGDSESPKKFVLGMTTCYDPSATRVYRGGFALDLGIMEREEEGALFSVKDDGYRK